MQRHGGTHRSLRSMFLQTAGPRGFVLAGGIHKWVMWVCMDGPDDDAWLQALDQDAGLNAQIIHLQESCTFRVKIETKKFQCKLTGDEKLMMVTNGGGEVLLGLPRCHRLGADRGHGKQNSMGAFLQSVCIRIGDYAHAGCRVTNASKKRLIETITT